MHAAAAEQIEVNDSRRTPRFIFDPPIEGSFNGERVLIYNITQEGVQIEHKEKLQRGTWGELQFSLPFSPRMIRLQGRVNWVRVAKQSNPLEAWPYRCGIRVEHLHALTIESLTELLRSRAVRPDKDSLERKRKKIAAQQQIESTVLPFVAQELGPPLTVDEAMSRVQASRAMLRRDPKLAEQHLTVARMHWSGAPQPDDLLAIWNHLGRTVDPNVIAVVIDLYPE
jgi:hypothetical protein